jgi:hypothetical protein
MVACPPVFLWEYFRKEVVWDGPGEPTLFIKRRVDARLVRVIFYNQIEGMNMAEKDILQLFLWLRKPIFWDPIPPWAKLNPDKLREFTEVQNRWNAKITEIDQQKVQELGKIAGIKM